MVPSTGGRAAASLPHQEPLTTGKCQALTAPGCVLSRAMSLPHGNPRGNGRDRGVPGQEFLRDCMSQRQVKLGDCTPFLPISPLPSLPILTMMYFWLHPAYSIATFYSSQGFRRNNQQPTLNPKVAQYRSVTSIPHHGPAPIPRELPPTGVTLGSSDIAQTGHSSGLTAP